MTTEPEDMTISELEVMSIALIRHVPASGRIPDAFAVAPLPEIAQMSGSARASLVQVTSPDRALLAIVSVSVPGRSPLSVVGIRGIVAMVVRLPRSVSLPTVKASAPETGWPSSETTCQVAVVIPRPRGLETTASALELVRNFAY